MRQRAWNLSSEMLSNSLNPNIYVALLDGWTDQTLESTYLLSTTWKTHPPHGPLPHVAPIEMHVALSNPSKLETSTLLRTWWQSWSTRSSLHYYTISKFHHMNHVLSRIKKTTLNNCKVQNYSPNVTHLQTDIEYPGVLKLNHQQDPCIQIRLLGSHLTHLIVSPL